jgi:hypothetical protein
VLYYAIMCYIIICYYCILLICQVVMYTVSGEQLVCMLSCVRYCIEGRGGGGGGYGYGDFVDTCAF